MKKNKNLIYAFFIPIIILLFIMLLLNFYPFGNKTLLMFDGIKQYPGFLGNLINSITDGKSIMYSFKGLLGINFYAVCVYYLFNITNIFALLFGTHNILIFYSIMILLKIGLCSLTMCILLNYLYKNHKNNLLFSICYSLMAYNVLYYINFMWFDSIIIFPLVILGIEKIFKEKKYIFYTITLTLSILSNFYIGYMICIFSVIYFFYKYILEKKKNKRIIIKYMLYSVISGLICSIVLVPIILELLNGKGTLFSGYFKEYFKFDLDFINVFYKLTIGSFSNGDLEYGSPNVYVSIFIFINFILYFFNKKISKKEKICTSIISIIFLLSMSFNLLDYFWQMMQMPIWYPVRYAFIFDLFLILIAIKNYNNYEKISLKKMIIIIGLILILIIIGFITCGNLIEKINLSAKLIYLGISIIFIIYYFVFINNNYLKKYIIILLIFELSLNTYLSFQNTGNTNKISEFNNNYNNSKEVLNKINDNDFYRLTIQNRTTKNNGLLLNYNDINYFSSVRNQKVFNMLDKYFDFSVTDSCNMMYYFNNPIYNALFGIKYYISEEKINYYSLLNNNKIEYLYKNNDATSLGFITNNKILKLKYNKNMQDNINQLVKTINNDNNNNNIISKINITSKTIDCNDNGICVINGNPSINYTFNVNNDSFLVINNKLLNNNNLQKYTIKVNNKVVGNNSNTPYEVNKNDKVEIIINPDNDHANTKFFNVYLINKNIYNNFVKNINKNKLKIIKHNNDNYLKTNINVNEDDSLLFTSISNDNGWKIYVDGKETKIEPILNGLIGIKINKGKHIITFKYAVPGLKTGLIITSISLVLVLFIIIKNKDK